MSMLKRIVGIILVISVYLIAALADIKHDLATYAIISFFLFHFAFIFGNGGVKLKRVNQNTKEQLRLIHEKLFMKIISGLFILLSTMITPFYLMYDHLLMPNWYIINLTIGTLFMWAGAFCHRGAVRQLGLSWVDGIVVLYGHEILVNG